MSPLLEARSLYRFYHAGDDETLALQGVSLAAEAGETLAVTGPSGSGKSTLLSVLAGLDEPDGGSVYIGEERLSRRSEEERARLRARLVGMVYQQHNLLGHLTVHDNMRVSQRLAGRFDHEWGEELLERCGLLSRATALPARLSGGELARAGLAVALAARPALVLADEPTGELDEETARSVMTLLREHAADGAAVVFVTHAEAVAAAADRRLELRDGRLQ